MRRLALLVTAAALLAQQAQAQTVSFVDCPIARETGPDTEVCFLTVHDGKIYGLTVPSDWGQPQLKHRVLVEGVVTPERTVCGGPTIDGRVSVLSEIDTACDTVLPFDGKIVGAAGGIFNSGPPEQRARMQDLARRAEADPSLSVQPVMAPPPPSAPPGPRLEIFFPFDSDRSSGPDMLTLWDMVKVATASKAVLRVTVRQGASVLDSGQTLAEKPGMAEQRGRKLAGVMTGLGLPPAQLKVVVDAAPQTGWRGRSAVIETGS